MENSSSALPSLNSSRIITQLKDLNLKKSKTMPPLRESPKAKLMSYIDLHAVDIDRIGKFDLFPELEFLDLSCNRISKIENLDQCNILQVLKLYGNKISKVENLGKLKELRYLQLQYNSIHNLDDGLKLRNLLFLRLDHNHLTEITCAQLSGCPQLETLNISNNKLTHLKVLKVLPQLEELFACCNQIRTPPDLTSCPLLKDVDLSNNRLSTVNGIRFLKKLQILNISENQLTELDFIGQQNQLNELLVNGNRLSTISTLSEQFPKLEILYLGFNFIESWTNLQVQLKALPCLAELQLTGNPFITSNGSYHAELIQDIPSLEILDGLKLKSNADAALDGRQKSAVPATRSMDTDMNFLELEIDPDVFNVISDRFNQVRNSFSQYLDEQFEREITESPSLLKMSGSRVRIQEARDFAASHFLGEFSENMADRNEPIETKHNNNNNKNTNNKPFSNSMIQSKETGLRKRTPMNQPIKTIDAGFTNMIGASSRPIGIKDNLSGSRTDLKQPIPAIDKFRANEDISNRITQCEDGVLSTSSKPNKSEYDKWNNDASKIQLNKLEKDSSNICLLGEHHQSSLAQGHLFKVNAKDSSNIGLPGEQHQPSLAQVHYFKAKAEDSSNNATESQIGLEVVASDDDTISHQPIKFDDEDFKNIVISETDINKMAILDQTIEDENRNKMAVLSQPMRSENGGDNMASSCIRTKLMESSNDFVSRSFQSRRRGDNGDGAVLPTRNRFQEDSDKILAAPNHTHRFENDIKNKDTAPNQGVEYKDNGLSENLSVLERPIRFEDDAERNNSQPIKCERIGGDGRDQPMKTSVVNRINQPIRAEEEFNYNLNVLDERFSLNSHDDDDGDDDGGNRIKLEEGDDDGDDSNRDDIGNNPNDVGDDDDHNNVAGTDDARINPTVDDENDNADDVGDDDDNHDARINFAVGYDDDGDYENDDQTNI